MNPKMNPPAGPATARLIPEITSRRFEFIFMPNVQDERRWWLAQSVLLGARSVTDITVRSSALLGSFFISDRFKPFIVFNAAPGTSAAAPHGLS
jgi:hypothetical protein